MYVVNPLGIGLLKVFCRLEENQKRNVARKGGRGGLVPWRGGTEERGGKNNLVWF